MRGSVPACLRARFRTFSETPFLTEKQDTGKEATICKQMPQRWAPASSNLLWVLSESQKQTCKRQGLEMHVYRITEQAELEGTPKDHWVQLLALHRSPQVTPHVWERCPNASGTQTGLVMCPLPWGACSSTQPPSGWRIFSWYSA